MIFYIDIFLVATAEAVIVLMVDSILIQAATVAVVVTVEVIVVVFPVITKRNKNALWSIN